MHHYSHISYKSIARIAAVTMAVVLAFVLGTFFWLLFIFLFIVHLLARRQSNVCVIGTSPVDYDANNLGKQATGV